MKDAISLILKSIKEEEDIQKEKVGINRSINNFKL